MCTYYRRISFYCFVLSCPAPHSALSCLAICPALCLDVFFSSISLSYHSYDLLVLTFSDLTCHFFAIQSLTLPHPSAFSSVPFLDLLYLLHPAISPIQKLL